MSVIEEHKEKRRALGRGLDSLLPSGPRLATASAPPPVILAIVWGCHSSARGCRNALGSPRR
jgi:hypothetical protein